MAQREKKAEGESKTERTDFRAKPETSVPMRYLVVSGRDHMQTSRSANGKVEDLSLSGLVFQTHAIRQDDLHLSYDESPLIRNRLIVEIDLPGGHRFTAVGEVSWYERSLVAKDTLYHVGVSFTEISVEDRKALKSYLVARERMPGSVILDV